MRPYLLNKKEGEKMKAKVRKAFFDLKDANKPYNEGYIYETEDPERFAELVENGFLFSEPAENEMLPDDGTNLNQGQSETDEISPEDEPELKETTEEKKVTRTKKAK